MIVFALVTVLFAGVAVWVFWPLTREGTSTTAADATADLEARREQLVEEIRELELDRDLGRLDEEEYRRLRRAREHELAQVLAALEQGEG